MCPASPMLRAIAAGGNHNLVLIGDAPLFVLAPGPVAGGASGRQCSRACWLPAAGRDLSMAVERRERCRCDQCHTDVDQHSHHQWAATNASFPIKGVVVSPPVILSITRWPLLFSLANGDTEMTADGFKLRVTGLAVGPGRWWFRLPPTCWIGSQSLQISQALARLNLWIRTPPTGQLHTTGPVKGREDAPPGFGKALRRWFDPARAD